MAVHRDLSSLLAQSAELHTQVQAAAGGAARVRAGQAGEVERGRLAALAAMSVRLGELVLAQLGKQRPTVGMANPNPNPNPAPKP